MSFYYSINVFSTISFLICTIFYWAPWLNKQFLKVFFDKSQLTCQEFITLKKIFIKQFYFLAFFPIYFILLKSKFHCCCIKVIEINHRNSIFFIKTYLPNSLGCINFFSLLLCNYFLILSNYCYKKTDQFSFCSINCKV